jgi:Predicted glycosyltransferases
MTSSGADTAGKRPEYSFGVVILNWNNADDTISCLNALALSDPRPQHIVIVDNGSETTLPLRSARESRSPRHSRLAHSNDR